MSKATWTYATLAVAALSGFAGIAQAVPTPNLVLTCSDPQAVGRAQNDCNGTWSYQVLTDQLLVLTGSSAASSWARASSLAGTATVAVCALPVEPGQYSSCRDQAGVRRIAFVAKASVGGRRSTLHVESHGIDGSACGGTANPCRSITQAINNARDGDWIVVGPGRYGNLDHDANLGEPGEEGTGRVCQCVVEVYKRVSIVSVNGASETIIDAESRNPSDATEVPNLSGVRIQVDGVTFGAPGHGFTVTGSSYGANGIVSAPVRGVRIAGNILTRNDRGLELLGTRNLVTNNVAMANAGAGFAIRGNDNVAWRNTAVAHGDGFLIDGSGNALLGNVSNGNGIGYSLRAGAATLSHNAAVGNLSAGVRFWEGATATLRRNNLYGNGAVPWTLPNCGLVNETGNSIDAAHNYWGASSGSGADPADDVCDGSGLTIRQPYADRRFEVAGASALAGESEWAEVVRFLESTVEAGIETALSLE